MKPNSPVHESDLHTEKNRHPTSVDQMTERNIALIAELDATAKSRRTFTDKVVDAITGFCGRIAFVWWQFLWFALWIGWNCSHVKHFDPYPFSLLSLLVCMEAIFLSTFILIGENRQARLSERRNHLDLQINLLAEQENTKILSMLVAIQKHLGIQDEGMDASVLLEKTEPGMMIQQIEAMIEGEDNLNSAEVDFDEAPGN